MYAVAQFHLVSMFSSRAVTTNAFAARTVVCPAPAALKLGLLSKLIERDGPARAQEHLDWLAPLAVAWSPPALLAVSAVTMTVLKDDNAKTPLVRSVGTREYVHYDEPFGLAIGDVPAERHDDLSYAFEVLRALGVAESLVQPVAPPTWEGGIPAGYTLLTDAAAQIPSDAGDEVCVLDDLGFAPRFERLSVYRPNDARLVPRLGEDRERTIVVLPLRQRQTSLKGRILERLASASDGSPTS